MTNTTNVEILVNETLNITNGDIKLAISMLDDTYKTYHDTLISCRNSTGMFRDQSDEEKNALCILLRQCADMAEGAISYLNYMAANNNT